MVVDQQFGSGWALYCGDSAEVLAAVPAASVGFAVYSPPFSSLYTYSASERDLGNSRGDTEFFGHYGYVTRELLRVMQPGRNIAVHCQQLTSQKAAHGVIGMRDFRGALIAHHVAEGWIYHGEICIDKDPQAQAIRTKSKSLMFVQKNKDRSWLRPALADYILLFRAPGDNAVPIRDEDVSNEDWISWARPIWYGIRETRTLNVVEARENADDRHVCPLQLDTLERCIRLWSNQGETVLDPFSGIGSTGYQVVLLGRRYLGIELKESYFRTSLKNLAEAERLAHEPSLFDDLEAVGDRAAAD